MSVWNTATVGTPMIPRGAQPAVAGSAGDARCTTSGEPAQHVIRGHGMPSGEVIFGNIRDGTRSATDAVVGPVGGCLAGGLSGR